MMLNGHCLRETTHEQAVEWFREAKTKIEIVISRMVESKLQKGNKNMSLFKVYLRPGCKSKISGMWQNKGRRKKGR